jgi:bifunctional non-homologous end joining protein LigD
MIDIVLHGRKLRGITLIKTENRSEGRGHARNWLLIKHRDEHADSSWNIETPALSRSVLTGRTLREIAEGGARRGR